MEHLILRNIIKDQHEVIKNAKIYDRNYKFENNIQYILVGLRRSGKSTILYSQALKLIKSGVDWNQIIYINFEDERLLEFKVDDFQDIILVKNELTDKKGYYFFDEIQNVDGWEKFARRMADSNEIVYITGSNSKMLSLEMNAKLGGRYISKYIMPYSFDEYINANGVTLDDSSKSIAQKSRKLENFMLFGGLPAVLNFIDKKEYITSVYIEELMTEVIRF